MNSCQTHWSMEMTKQTLVFYGQDAGGLHGGNTEHQGLTHATPSISLVPRCTLAGVATPAAGWHRELWWHTVSSHHSRDSLGCGLGVSWVGREKYKSKAQSGCHQENALERKKTKSGTSCGACKFEACLETWLKLLIKWGWIICIAVLNSRMASLAYSADN